MVLDESGKSRLLLVLCKKAAWLHWVLLGRVPAASVLECMSLHPEFLLQYCELSHFLPGC